MARSRTQRGAILALLLLLAGCEQRASLEGKIVQEVKDPSENVTALVTRADPGGATVPFVYRVYLQGRSGRGPTEIMRADHVGEIRIAWTAPQRLSVTLKCGTVYGFTNFYDDLDAAGDLSSRSYVSLNTTEDCGDSKR